MGGVANRNQVFEPSDVDVKGALENVMAVTGGIEFDAVCIGEAFCGQVVGQVIDVHEKYYGAYDRALENTTYCLSRLGLGCICVHIKGLPAKEMFNPAGRWILVPIRSLQFTFYGDHHGQVWKFPFIREAPGPQYSRRPPLRYAGVPTCQKR